MSRPPRPLGSSRIAPHLTRTVCMALCALLVAGCTARKPALVRGTAPGPTVILVSIDGFRADYLKRGLSPQLRALAARGVRARWMTPSFPTQTFPNHYTLVTGRYPDDHGIVDNIMEDRTIQPDSHFRPSNPVAVGDARWWNEATPLWVSIEQQGGRAATMFWPGAAAAIHGVRPTYRVPFDAKMPAVQRVAQVLAWLDLPPDRRPRFITLYFNAVDSAGHRYGPDSPEVDAAIAHVDGAIGQLIKGVHRRGMDHTTDIVVVSDHGFATVPPGHEIHLDHIVDTRVLRPVTLMAVAELRPAPNAGKARVSSAEARLLAPHPHMQCWKKQHLPARFHYGRNARVPPLVCLAQTGWLIVTRRVRSHWQRPPRGAHGYDNADPRMRALFIAAGPSFRRSYTAPPFPNVDVYPLLAHILGISPEPNDGSYAAIEGMRRPAAR